MILIYSDCRVDSQCCTKLFISDEPLAKKSKKHKHKRSKSKLSKKDKHRVPDSCSTAGQVPLEMTEDLLAGDTDEMDDWNEGSLDLETGTEGDVMIKTGYVYQILICIAYNFRSHILLDFQMSKNMIFFFTTFLIFFLTKNT